jgi:H+/Na+-translocating ferredoxin:NAD+ oxidoreductase subunit C
MSETKNDREIDAAWRAASREEPPAALDAAIRAEARRAVGAAPEDVRRRRRRQLRYPFAAAATVALLAFGISQMVPPHQDAMIVADQTAAPRPAPLSRSAPAPRAPMNAAAPVPAPEPSVNAAAPVPQPSTNAIAPRDQAPERVRETERSVSRPATKEATREEQPSAAAPSGQDAGIAGKLAASPAAPEPSTSPAPRAQSGAPVSRQESAAPSSSAANAPTASQPFPAGAGGEVPKALAEKLPAPASAPAMGARRDRASVDALAQAQKPQQPAPPAVAATLEKRSASSPQALAQSSSLDDAKAKQAGAGSVEAWIARIRALKANGEAAAAARELAAFRDTYGDRADALLPRDLRGVTTPDNKGQ